MSYLPQIDAYIEKAQPFAKPILNHFRELVHKACPDVEEKIKWGMPFFDFMGPMCMMASFKQHCSLGFWKAALMKDPVLIENAKGETAMGHLGKINSLKDLPSDKKLIGYIKEAMQLNIDGVKLVKQKPTTKAAVVVPADILQKIKKHKKAYQTFEAFADSHKREYITWINEAKSEPTKEKRSAQMLEWLTEGKSRHWKYK